MSEVQGPTYTDLYAAEIIRRKRLPALWRESAKNAGVDFGEQLVREVMSDPKTRDAVREALGNWDRSAEGATTQTTPAASRPAPEGA